MFSRKFKKHASHFSKQKITTTKKETNLPQRASLKICENSVLRPTCLKKLLWKFARILCFGALNSDPPASNNFSDILRVVLWSTFVQTHLPQKTEHEGASAGSAKRKQFMKTVNMSRTSPFNAQCLSNLLTYLNANQT